MSLFKKNAWYHLLKIFSWFIVFYCINGIVINALPEVSKYTSDYEGLAEFSMNIEEAKNETDSSDGFFGTVSKNIKKYYGIFTKSLQADLWLAVSITFVLVFLACLAVYTLVNGVQVLADLCKCFGRRGIVE
ncbi:uncharacterized protein [Parasteatoda tepidariorum]|uniref:uncharacterized protein n=1 Tax=Parasteatoda tepidariorum TaxID=114398 RepID=UPI001C723ED5|nr:uncharacterized protein LOC107436936 isoform X1 [Parasteatoda tepidariorum]